MQVGKIDVNKLRGVGDKALGLGKELVGVLLGSDRWQQEGEAQQERAAAQLKSLRDEVRAQKAEARADVLEARQRSAQRAKESTR